MRNQDAAERGRTMKHLGIGNADHAAGVASWKSTAGSRRRRPITIFWFKSASAWKSGLMHWGSAPRAGLPPVSRRVWDFDAGLIAHPRELGPFIPQVTVDALSIRQVECDSPKHLLQV